MAEICRFGNVVISMFSGDHPPPHFHISVRGRHAKMYIESLELYEGELTRPQHRLVRKWARVRQDELRRAWRQAANDQQPDRIAPLDR